jgi:hypothetical protein
MKASVPARTLSGWVLSPAWMGEEDFHLMSSRIHISSVE